MPEAERKRVLLIDDNEIDMFINQRVLEFNDFASEIDQVNSAEVAISMLKDDSKTKPDVIFLDLNMPIVDGFMFLFEYSKLDPEVRKAIKIVVLTSSDNKRDREKIGANSDVLTYMSKPLNDEKLSQIKVLL